MRAPCSTVTAFSLACLLAWSSASRAADIAKGADVSSLQQMADPSQGTGPFQFYDTDGLQRDPDQVTNCLKILKERGIDTIRLRVLVPPIVSPYWDNQLYGHSTIQEVVPIAVKANALGLRLLINLDYSWTLADPANQRLPVNWANEVAGMSATDAVNTLANEVSAHTTDVVNQLKAAGVTPEWVALGNEITNGMLLHVENSITNPSTRTSPNYGSRGPNLAKFINAGYNAVKAIDPNIKVVIHIDRAHNDGLDRGFFDSLKANGGHWDVSATDTSANLPGDIQTTVNDLAARFNTPGAGGDGVLMMEIDPPNEYGSGNNLFNPYPNFDFVTNMLTVMRAIPNGKGVGVLYWEPACDPDWRNYYYSAFTNHEPTSVLDAFRPAILHTSGTNIIGGDGKPLQLKGVNLGGWMVMETWMTPADSSGLKDEYSILQTLDSRFGVATEQSLIKTYRQSWITTHDLDNIKAQGLNVVRVPVWWGDFYPLSALSSSTAPALRSDAFALLDTLVQQASERGIYTVIDMHGVFGGQSTSDSTGQANANQYWTSATNQANTQAMWSAIAAHFRGNAWVAGYDLLNEPDGAPSQQAVVTQFNNLYTAVRTVDPDHLIFMEGTFGHSFKPWAQWGWGALPSPASQGWTNVVYEMHEYQFNTTDANVQKGADNQVNDFNNHKASYNVPCYLGEFNDFNYGDAWAHSISAFNGAGMSWSSWSYKATHGPAPDSWGLYDPNGKWTTVPNIATDSSSTISTDWSKWTTAGTFTLNPLISNIIIGPPAITSYSQAFATSGAAFNYQITASGQPTSFNATGLPNGLSVNTSTGLISGTTSNNGGSFNVGLSAVTAGGTATATLRLTVNPPANYPVITSANAASGVVGTSFSYKIAARNGPTSYGATGLPAGLAINKTTGVISGTPTAAATYNVVLAAANGTGMATQNLALTITAGSPPPTPTPTPTPTPVPVTKPVISSATSASGTVGKAFSYQITASNTPTSFSATGLPAGLGVNATSGLIAGTPTSAGTASVSLGASNAGGTGTATLSITVGNPPPPVPASPTGLTGFGWDKQVDLRWTPSANATGYNVLRSTAANGTYTTVGSNVATAYYSDTTVADGVVTSYFYKVSATDSAGTSAASTPLNVTTVPSGFDAWATGDVGTVGAVGSSSYLDGTYTVTGSGTDVWFSTDAFQFVSQPLVGDGSIEARVATESNTNAWSKAGVMIRETLDPSSAYASVFVSPRNGIATQWRAATGENALNVNQTGLTAPSWVKLVRAGNVFTSYYSADGVNWTLQSTQTIPMASSVRVGLEVCAHNNAAVCTATFDSVNVLPASTAWLADDLGAPAIAGFTAYSGGVLTLNGAGNDIWNTSDQFHYVYQPVSGDCDMTVQVTGVENVSAYSKVGVMIRDTLAANSANVALVSTPHGGIALQARPTTGGNSSNLVVNAALNAPYWVRLTRTGNLFTAYVSADGTSWTQFGSTSVTMGTSVYIGVPMTARIAAKLSTGTVTNITVHP